MTRNFRSFDSRWIRPIPTSRSATKRTKFRLKNVETVERDCNCTLSMSIFLEAMNKIQGGMRSPHGSSLYCVGSCLTISKLIVEFGHVSPIYVRFTMQEQKYSSLALSFLLYFRRISTALLPSHLSLVWFYSSIWYSSFEMGILMIMTFWSM